MRKFNLKENAAKRMIGMQKAGLSEKDAYADVPAEQAADPGISSGIRIVWRTDIGRIRQNNQDAVIIGSGLAGVADGMGGHNAGEVASCGLRDGLVAETAGCEPNEETLTEAIKTVNHDLYARQENDNLALQAFDFMEISQMNSILSIVQSQASFLPGYAVD